MDATSNPWTYLRGGSHAKTYPKQGNAPVLKELAAAFGLSSPVSLGSFDQDTCSLRTSQACLFTTGYEELSESFPDSGMWVSGEVYELQSSAPVTCESGCSLWPTATSSVDSGSAAYSTESVRHAGTTLTDAIRNWATPKALTGGANSNREARRERTGKTGGADLQEQITHWQTPGTDSFRSRGGDRKDEMGLDQEARNWGTPRTSDYKGSGPMGSKSQAHMEGKGYLCAQTEHWIADFNSLPAPQTQDGPQSSGSGQTSRRLSPRFVEFLMGFPIGWTELCPTEPNASDD